MAIDEELDRKNRAVVQQSWAELNPYNNIEPTHPKSLIDILDDFFVNCVDKYKAPTIINTFLEAYDFSGKTIVPFATSGGSDMGKTNEWLAPSCPGAKLVEGKVLRGTYTREMLDSWVKSLNL